MTCRLAGAAAALAAALVASPPEAAAKGPVAAAWACGPAACVPITGRPARRAIGRALETADGPVAPVQPFYRIRTRPALAGGEMFLLPRSGLLQAVHAGLRLGPRTAAVLRVKLAAIAPFRPRVTQVWARARRAAHPGVYLRILREAAVRPPADVWSMPMVPVAIELPGRTP